MQNFLDMSFRAVGLLLVLLPAGQATAEVPEDLRSPGLAAG